MKKNNELKNVILADRQHVSSNHHRMRSREEYNFNINYETRDHYQYETNKSYNTKQRR